MSFERKFGSRARVRRIKHEPCAACKAMGRKPTGFSANAHCPPANHGDKGVAYKAGWRWIVPLCDACHRLRDEVLGSNEAFMAQTGVDLTRLARITAGKFPIEDYPDDGLAF